MALKQRVAVALILRLVRKFLSVSVNLNVQKLQITNRKIKAIATRCFRAQIFFGGYCSKDTAQIPFLNLRVFAKSPAVRNEISSFSPSFFSLFFLLVFFSEVHATSEYSRSRIGNLIDIRGSAFGAFWCKLRRFERGTRPFRTLVERGRSLIPRST